MRVAFLAPEFIPPVGGVGTYSFELVRELSKHLEVHVITPYRGLGSKEVESLFGGRIKVHMISKADDDFFYNLRFQLALMLKFKQLHRIYGFDLVHSANLVQMPDIFTKIDIPMVVTVHTTLSSQTVKRMPASLAELWPRVFYPFIMTLEKIYARRHTNFISVCRYIKDRFRQEHGKDSRLIYNGLGNFESEYRFREIEKIDKPKVLYSARMTATKGYRLVLRAAECLPGHCFIFAGGKARSHPANCIFLGKVPRSRLPSLYKACDMYVLPSSSESFPYSILESLACKTPVIASSVGGIPEMISTMVDPCNADELVQAIKAGKAATVANADFSARAMAEETIKLYEEIV